MYSTGTWITITITTWHDMTQHAHSARGGRTYLPTVSSWACSNRHSANHPNHHRLFLEPFYAPPFSWHLHLRLLLPLPFSGLPLAQFSPQVPIYPMHYGQRGCLSVRRDIIILWYRIICIIIWYLHCGCEHNIIICVRISYHIIYQEWNMTKNSGHYCSNTCTIKSTWTILVQSQCRILVCIQLVISNLVAHLSSWIGLCL